MGNQAIGARLATFFLRCPRNLRDKCFRWVFRFSLFGFADVGTRTKLPRVQTVKNALVRAQGYCTQIARNVA